MCTVRKTPLLASERLLVGWHTNIFDGLSHAVTDAEFCRGIHRQIGQFHTVCRRLICLASSFTPCGRRCPDCTTLLQPSVSLTHNDTQVYDMIPATWPYSQSAYEAFAAMKKTGFTHYCCGDRHAPHVLVSAYDWENSGYIDVVNIRGMDRVTAARLPKYDGLDIFAPTQAVWHYMGALEPTVAAMLRLPPPHHPDAPTIPYLAPLTLFVSTREQRPMTVKPGKQR